jgi:hypothetical protein
VARGGKTAKNSLIFGARLFLAVYAENNGQVTNFFGTLKEIIQLDYNERSVVLFKCD